MSIRVTVELDRSTLAKLDALAADTNRPRDLLMREAVEGFVAHEAAIIGTKSGGGARGAKSVPPSLEPLLSEWNSPEDAEAYDDL